MSEHSLDLREQLARIDQMQADIIHKQQEVRLAPWALVLTGLTTGAALMGGGAALFAALLKWVGP
ncbi:hypothetical protein JQ543_13675 [Bradyrhizobium diazoefficiens]|nr:hypothetical protein [Bradyrhizobium diazoefficiens]MBR0848797.1 hypothetical protein [Bradyrhizobium diazoefficiens]